MNTFLTVLGSILISAAAARASTDGTQLTNGDSPDRPFRETLAVATKALGNDFSMYMCISARAKTRASGGGWQFFFGSSDRDTQVVHVQRKGKIEKDLAAPQRKLFPPKPRVSISDALSSATTLMRSKSPEFFFTGADWSSEGDKWHMWFNNSAADSALVVVDASGKARLDGVSHHEQRR